MNQKKELIKNTIIIGIGKFTTQVLSFLLLPLYTAQLTPTEYGVYDFLYVLSIFLAPIITVLMEESMFRFLIDADSEDKKIKIINQSVIYIIISILIFSILGSILIKVINYEYGIIFIVYMISNIMVSLGNAVTRGTGKFKIYSISNCFTGIITIALNIYFLVILHLGVKGMLFASIIGNMLVSSVVLIKMKIFKNISVQNIDKKLLKEMIKYSLPLVPNNVSLSIINLSDRLVITGFLGNASNGIYAISNKIPNIMSTFYSFFYTAWQESSAKALQNQNFEEYYNSIYSIIKKFLYAIMVCIIAVIPLVFNILINSEYREAYMYIPILILAVYYSNISGFYGGVFTAYKDTKILGITTTIAAIINLVVNILLIKFIGVYAAAISTLVANFVVNMYRKINVKKYVNLKEEKSILNWAILICIVISYYINNFIISILISMVTIIYSVCINKEMIISLFKTYIKK